MGEAGDEILVFPGDYRQLLRKEDLDPEKPEFCRTILAEVCDIVENPLRYLKGGILCGMFFDGPLLLALAGGIARELLQIRNIEAWRKWERLFLSHPRTVHHTESFASHGDLAWFREFPNVTRFRFIEPPGVFYEARGLRLEDYPLFTGDEVIARNESYLSAVYEFVLHLRLERFLKIFKFERLRDAAAQVY